MKLCFYKLVIICVLLSPAVVRAQDNQLKIHALSLGGGIASTTSESAETGLGIGLDLSTIVNNHIISFFINVGSDIRTAAGKQLFLELNFTYGRKWQFGQYLVLEGHLGAGLFIYDLDIEPNLFGLDFPDATIGFPFRVKFIYYPMKKVGIGINPNVNLNSITTAYDINLFLQYNFN
jgi:hypothetical protein